MIQVPIEVEAPEQMAVVVEWLVTLVVVVVLTMVLEVLVVKDGVMSTQEEQMQED